MKLIVRTSSRHPESIAAVISHAHAAGVVYPNSIPQHYAPSPLRWITATFRMDVSRLVQYLGLRLLPTRYGLRLMNTDLLRSWLGLPPGAWPPKDRELLGLGEGGIDPSIAERRAMERMTILRPHQLRNPDLVTEGMNRIAQALLAVTAYGGTHASPKPAKPAKPAKPVQSVSPPEPARFQPVEIAPAPAPPASPVPDPDSVATSSNEATSDQVVLDAEVYDALPAVLLPTLPQPAPAVCAEVRPVQFDDADPIELPVPAVGPQRLDRREAYHELAALRALVHAWEELRSFLGDPSEGLHSPATICEFLEAVRTVREAEQHPALPPDLLSDTAPSITRLLHQPLILATFRSLVHTQRTRLAREWAVGRATFHDQAEQLRDRLRESRPRPTLARQFQQAADRLAWNPEWVLLLATGMLLLFAWLRIPSAGR